MTFVDKQHINDNYYIVLERDKRYNSHFCYVVQVCPIIGGLVGYPEREMIYSINERQKALATFNRYKKKYI